MDSVLEYKGYSAIVDYDADDELFVGEVLGIADSLNFHGRSVDELKQSFHDSIDNYLDICQKIGKDPEREFKGSFNVRIPPMLHRQAYLCARKQRISLNQYVANSLSAAVRGSGEENSWRAC